MNRLPDVMAQLDRAAVPVCLGTSRLYYLRLVPEALRSGDGQGETQIPGGLDQRMADIVAVADERHPEPGQVSELLPERHHIGQRLTRVMVIGKRVDDRDRGVVGQLLDP